MLASGATVMREKMVEGIEADVERARWLLEQNVIIITALVPVIGYDRSAEVAKKAHTEGITLRQAAVELGFLTAEEFDELVRPDKMARP